VVLGLVGAYATFVLFAWRDVSETHLSVDEVARIDRAYRAVAAANLRPEIGT
jgi:cytochrome o ubiquinol oxidase subunit 1